MSTEVKNKRRKPRFLPISMWDHWHSSVPDGKSGNCEIKGVSITNQGAMIHNMKCLISGMLNHEIAPGEYTQLLIDGEVMMSDTQKEFVDHADLFRYAEGHVLMLGLGLGCAASVVASIPEVTKVTIIEISPDVIALTGPTIMEKYGDKVEIICADAHQWEPEEGVRYGAVWADIWLMISDDNLPEMRVFRDKFEPLSDWMGCWSEEEVLIHKANGRWAE